MRKIALKIIKRFFALFKNRCPNCETPMNSVFFDMKLDGLVFECTKCKKEWI